MISSIAVFIAFMLITPGFCAVIGMRMASKHELTLESDNTTTQVLVLIVVTTCIQLITFSLWMALGQIFDWINAAGLVGETATVGGFLVTNGSFNWAHWLFVVCYVASTYALSGWLGFILIKRIETGKFNTSFFHGALYELVVKGREPPFIYCTIVTKISHNGRSLMYMGILERIIYESQRQIKYVLLSDVNKFALKVGEEQVTTLGLKNPVAKNKRQFGKKLQSGEHETKVSELFYIHGSEISNILFSEYDIKETNMKILQDLEAENAKWLTEARRLAGLH